MEDQDPIEAAADAIRVAGGLVSITNLKAYDEDSVDDVEINYAGELTPSLSEWIARVMAPFPLKYRLVPESAYPDPEPVGELASNTPEPASELLHVLAVNLAATSTEGGRVIVPSVELWSDCVRWQITQTPMPAYFSYMKDRGFKKDATDDSAPRRPGRYSMRDDVGTSYRISGGTGGGDGHRAWVLHVTFVPAVPEGAGQISLRDGSLGAEVISVELPTDD